MLHYLLTIYTALKNDGFQSVSQSISHIYIAPKVVNESETLKRTCQTQTTKSLSWSEAVKEFASSMCPRRATNARLRGNLCRYRRPRFNGGMSPNARTRISASTQLCLLVRSVQRRNGQRRRRWTEIGDYSWQRGQRNDDRRGEGHTPAYSRASKSVYWNSLSTRGRKKVTGCLSGDDAVGWRLVAAVGR